MATILIAEDDRIVLRLMSFILTEGGHQVITAGDGQAALEQLSEQEVDIVIADIMMPRMDGLTLLERLKADSRLAGLPVIVLTASADRSVLTQVAQAGATLILSKPVATQELLETVNGLFT